MISLHILLVLLSTRVLVDARAALLSTVKQLVASQPTDTCSNNTDPDCLSGSTWTHFASNFDNLIVDRPIQAYTNVIFNGFTVATPPRIDGHPYKNHLGPTSPPNFARAPPSNSSFTPQVNSQTNQYQKVKWFDFGCFSYDPNPYAPPENAIPAACNLSIQSWVDQFASPVASFQYAPHGILNAALTFANLTAIDRDFIADTTIFIAESIGGTPLILYIDTLVGVNYTLGPS